MSCAPEADRPLAPLTTLGLGGPAAYFVEARTRDEVDDALAWAKARGVAVRVLGGGSNLVISDAGVPALVLRIATTGVAIERTPAGAIVTAQAGECWDELVQRAIDEQLFGIECLTGIPGSVGATPIQNVGAYGQEVAEVIDAVEIIDRQRDARMWMTAEACGFGYRDSRFKREPGRFVVLAVRLKLASHGMPRVRYAELARVLAARDARPDLRTVHAAVRALRAQKGMLIAPGWERSAGSFFTNPIVTEAEAARVVERALSSLLIGEAGELPRFALGDGRVKLAAGFLIERAGIAKGLRRGAVGVSRHHALALVHHGGGTTRELMALAAEIQQQVRDRFGVMLAPEPVCW